MSSIKWASIIAGVVDSITYDPDREWIVEFVEVPTLDENGEPTGETEKVITGGHWGDILPPWVLVPDDVYAGYIQNPDGTFSPPPPVIVPDPEAWTILADVPWTRMTEEEAELVQGGIDSAPVKTRQMINKATSFTTGTDAFIKFKAIIEAALGSAIRAHEIMKWLSMEESMSAEEPVSVEN